VSLAGRLETLDLSALLQTLAASHASGRLTLTRLDRQAVLALRRGRVVYVSGGAPGETLASRLLQQGLAGEKDVLAALERQHDGTASRRLGDVLVEMGVLAEGTLEAVVRQQMQELVTSLLAWQGGFFRFDPAPGGGESVDVDRADFVLRTGLAPEELLMRAVTALDAGQITLPPGLRPGSPAPPPPTVVSPTEPSPTGSYVADYTGEAILSLLRFASQIVPRAVVFAVESDVARSVGEFGARLAGRPGGEAAREVVFSLREPSILRVAVERRRAYVGPVEPTRVNMRLLEALGGGPSREAVALPLLVAGEVRFVLYGDDGASGRPLGPIDALEAAAARAARIVEKTMAARGGPSPNRAG
jgi:hypothetical protein